MKDGHLKHIFGSNYGVTKKGTPSVGGAKTAHDLMGETDELIFLLLISCFIAC